MERQRMNKRSDELRVSTMNCIKCGKVYESNVISAYCEDCNRKMGHTDTPYFLDGTSEIRDLQGVLLAKVVKISDAEFFLKACNNFSTMKEALEDFDRAYKSGSRVSMATAFKETQEVLSQLKDGE